MVRDLTNLFNFINWGRKAVRIRQRDCKSRPLGSGSSPPAPTIYSYGQMVRQFPDTEKISGSNPDMGTNGR